MIKYVTGYSLKQWLMSLWVAFTEWDLSTSTKNKISLIGDIILYALAAVLAIVDFYAVFLILYAFS